MVLPNHIEQAERIGMPEDKVEVHRCRQCDAKVIEWNDKCDECKKECCPECWVWIPDIGFKFCCESCARTRLLKLLAAAEMNDKPITEHPDVQRLIGQVVELQAEKEAVKTQYARDLVATNWAYFPKPVCKNQPPEITNGYNACLSCPMRKTCLLIFEKP